VGSTVSLGTATVGDSVSLAIEWDRALNKFTFVRDNGAASATIPYSLSDGVEPSVSFKSVGTRTEVANCTAAATSASIDATFDNVNVNTRAKP
jgi:hypothetical protein